MLGVLRRRSQRAQCLTIWSEKLRLSHCARMRLMQQTASALVACASLTLSLLIPFVTVICIKVKVPP